MCFMQWVSQFSDDIIPVNFITRFPIEKWYMTTLWKLSQWMSLFFWSIVVLVHRWGIYFTVCTHNWSDEFNYIACSDFLNILFAENKRYLASEDAQLLRVVWLKSYTTMLSSIRNYRQIRFINRKFSNWRRQTDRGKTVLSMSLKMF